MRYCTALALVEEVRRRGAAGASVVLVLGPAESVRRVRGSASFVVSVWHSWIPAGVFRLVDSRGHDKALTLAQVAKLAAAVASGEAMAVQIRMADASALPLPWDDARTAMQARRVAAVDLDA